MKKIIAKINKTKTWFFEKIKKIDEPLTRKGKNEKGKVITDTIKYKGSQRLL